MRTPAKKKPVKISNTQQKFLDRKNFGDEPKLHKGSSKVEVIKAFNWQNYMVDIPTTIGYLSEYIETFDPKLASKVRAMPQKDISLSHARIARMIAISPSIPDDMKTSLDDYVSKLRAIPKQPAQKQEVPQDRPKSKDDSVIVFLESCIDAENYVNVYEYLTSNQISKTLIPDVVSKYTKLYNEVDVAWNKTDKQVTEAYSCFSRKNLKTFREWLVRLIEDCDRYLENKRKEQKPRKKKVKSADAILKLFKYQKSYDEMRVTSINPEAILTSGELYVYNTKYKTLTYFHAKDGQKLSVHRTSIINYDEEKSFAKKVGRKEKQVLEFLNSSSKVQSRNVFDIVTTERLGVSDRVNENVVLLKAYKA